MAPTPADHAEAKFILGIVPPKMHHSCQRYAILAWRFFNGISPDFVGVAGREPPSAVWVTETNTLFNGLNSV